jgi:hypothetical protein
MRVPVQRIGALCAVGLLMLQGCGSHDPLDAPITADTLAVQLVDTTDLRLLGLGFRPAFVWSCGSFRLTEEERRAADLTDALIRAQGGVVCE